MFFNWIEKLMWNMGYFYDRVLWCNVDEINVRKFLKGYIEVVFSFYVGIVWIIFMNIWKLLEF